MQIIDFDAKFTEVLNDWIDKNRHRFRRPDDMENEVPDVYLRWLNTPADWLGGATPDAYFERYDSSAELCEMLKAYIEDNQKSEYITFSLRKVSSREENSLPKILQLGFPLTQFSYLYDGVNCHLNHLFKKKLRIR